jgi:hypothetical protein
MLKFKDLMERINETRSLNLEEVESIDENFDSNSNAHQAAKNATKGWSAKHSKATYHPDGTATITTNGRLADDPHNKHDISKQVDMKSHHVVNLHLRDAGGTHGMTADETHGHKEKLNGVNWKVKEKTKPSLYKAGSHEIHLSEGVEGLDESRMKDLAMDMESLSHADFKKKHKRSKQEMQDALKSEGVTLDELSVDTLRSYRAKAKDDAYDAADVDDDRRLRKRSMGSWDAGKKILKKGAPLRKEEIEQTDEELKGNQHKIDANKNGKVDGHDFKILRNAKKARYQ